MVSRLNPIRINISFTKRTYRLVDAVSVRVDFTAETDVVVREARIGMECQIRYTEMQAGLRRSGVISRGPAVIPGTAPQIVSEPVEVELSDTYPAQTFLTDRRLQAGRLHSSSVRLEIPSELARNGAYAQSTARPVFRWRIVVTADVTLARDVTESRLIDVSLGGREAN